MKTKKIPEKSIVKEVREVITENILAETKNTDIQDNTLSQELLRKMNAYWRAANYLSVGQIYLYDNPLLKEPLENVTCEAAGGWTLGNNTRSGTSYMCI